MSYGRTRLILGAVALILAGCADEGPARKATYPVTGEVLVDGKPASQVQVILHDLNGMDEQQPTISSTFTDDAGKFSVSTYEQGDGAPEGEYAVTFFWGQLNLVSMQYGGPDKLKNKYDDPKTTPFRIKVEKGKPADMGKVELKTT